MIFTSMTTRGPGSRRRAFVEHVSPCVDFGAFPAKRCVGDVVVVEADAFVDGHDVVRCMLLWRRAGQKTWQEIPMQALGNDRWRATFVAEALGGYEYTIAAWPDALATWLYDLARWQAADDIAIALAMGADVIDAAASRARGNDARQLKAFAATLRAPADDPLAARSAAQQSDVLELAARHADRSLETRFEPVLPLTVDPPRARFSSWYEMFPRSAGDGRTHGTFKDCIARLPYVRAMGFDVLYLPPIHPIGVTRRKGPNNTLVAGPGDPGSPWAIGGSTGGHKAIHAELGTLADFRALVDAARAAGIEVALDIAFQCSPDHPYVQAHPEWFRHRPDGSVQFAENPPKKYEDIYPLHFDTATWEALWTELLGIFQYWIRQGVNVFRVDNPHTKPLRMWQWLIAEVKREHPQVIFLAEAFTRPRVMHALAKLGYSQSYTYFTWRNTKAELVEYFTELSSDPSRDYFRPNVWPNTPDILHEALQTGGPPIFASRLLLAATLAANYGIYGPAFELQEHLPRGKGEEYLDSEKYVIRAWDRDRGDSLAPFIGRVNAARHAHAALQQDWNLAFLPADNDAILAYAKWSDDQRDVVIVVVNLDPRNVQSGWVQVDGAALGIDPVAPFVVHDLLAAASYEWRNGANFVRLDPQVAPGHLFHVRVPRSVIPESLPR